MRILKIGACLASLLWAVQLVAQQNEGVSGVWGSGSALVVARYDNPTGKLVVLRSGGSPVIGVLGFAGATHLARVRLDTSSDVFLLSGYDSTQGNGWIAAVTNSNGVLGPPELVWVGSVPAESVSYSAVLGQLVFFSNTNNHVHWASFSPATLTVGSWLSQRVHTSSMGGGSHLSMALNDDPQLAAAVLTLQTSDAPGSRTEVLLSSGGLASASDATPMLGARVGICGQAIVNDQQIFAFGPPGTLLEAFVPASNQVIGYGVADLDGDAVIDVTGMNIGDRVEVRDSVTGQGTGSQRVAYGVVGFPVAGPTGVKPIPFGGNLAATMYAGDDDFRVLCLADSPASAPASLPAVAVFGYNSNIAFSSDVGGYIIADADVILFFPAGMRREGVNVSGSAPVPIPAWALGLQLCVQWLALDGVGTVASNIACVTVQGE